MHQGKVLISHHFYPNIVMRCHTYVCLYTSLHQRRHAWHIHAIRVLDFFGWFSCAVKNGLWNNSFNKCYRVVFLVAHKLNQYICPHTPKLYFLCSVDRTTRYIHLMKNQLDAQFIFSIFRQTPLHVSGISIAHHQEVHRMDTTIGTYCSF